MKNHLIGVFSLTVFCTVSITTSTLADEGVEDKVVFNFRAGTNQHDDLGDCECTPNNCTRVGKEEQEAWAVCYRSIEAPKVTENSPTGATRISGTAYRRTLHQFGGYDNGDYPSYIVPGIDSGDLATLTPTDPDECPNGCPPPKGFTVQAWFRRTGTVADTEKQVIFSNTQSAGYSLRIQNNKLYGNVNISKKYYNVTSEKTIEFDKDYTAVFIAQMFDIGSQTVTGDKGETGSTGVILSLIIDGEIDKKSVYVIGKNPEILNNTVPPMIGAEPNGWEAPATWGFFEGFIESVNVRNYPVIKFYYNAFNNTDTDATGYFKLDDNLEPSENFFLSGAPLDGGIYNGQPSYHDWNWSKPIETRITNLSNTVTLRGVKKEVMNIQDYVNIEGLVPFSNDGYIVQGVANSCEGVQVCETERVYLSFYWKSFEKTVKLDTDGDTEIGMKKYYGSGLENPSIVAEIVPGSGSGVTRCWHLPETTEYSQRYSHVGGIAFFNGSIYVASSHNPEGKPKYGVITKYQIPAAPVTEPGRLMQCGTLVPQQTWAPLPAGSFLSFFQRADGTNFLFTGQYCDGSCWRNGGVPVAYRYLLEEDSNGNLPSKLPVYTKMALPARAQGIAFREPDPGQNHGYEVVVSVSGETTAGIKVYDYDDIRCDGYGNEQSCEDAHNKIHDKEIQTLDYINMPNGMEDLAIVNNTQIWSASESGAHFLQKKPISPWKDDFFPFIFTFYPWLD